MINSTNDILLRTYKSKLVGGVYDAPMKDLDIDDPLVCGRPDQ